MDRRERERILREGEVGDPHARDQAFGRRLAEDLHGSPLRGRPLPRRLRNFRPSVESYAASQGGALPYMARLREIEAATGAHAERLAAEWRRLAEDSGRDARRFEDRWRRLADRWDFGEINELIELHNRWFPVEARLPMDPRTGDFVLVAGRSYRREPLNAGWVLATFPPLLERAAA